MMAKPLVGLSLMLEQDFLLATLPLFQAGEVECLEWSFDIGWGPEQPQNWADELIDQFSADGRLFGHGVTFSPLSGQWHQRQQEWLDRLVVECSGRTYRHISEHFGFMTAGDFHRSAPLPVPMTPDSIRVGQDRLRRLADVARVPIGLENLAFAFGPQDVRDQGPFLNELLRPIDGFLLLDLHNIYCQMCNFDAPSTSCSQVIHSTWSANCMFLADRGVIQVLRIPPRSDVTRTTVRSQQRSLIWSAGRSIIAHTWKPSFWNDWAGPLQNMTIKDFEMTFINLAKPAHDD